MGSLRSALIVEASRHLTATTGHRRGSWVSLDPPILVPGAHVTMHKRVLIANRGEIAIRIAKAAASLGIESVSVYAPVDALSLHTRFTTETRQIGDGKGGAGDAVAAYLDIAALIHVAKSTGCDAVHPGYGFEAQLKARLDDLRRRKPVQKPVDDGGS